MPCSRHQYKSLFNFMGACANVRLQIVYVCARRACPFLCLHPDTHTHSHLTHTWDTNECILSIIKCNLKPSRRVLICMLSLMVRIISVSVSERRMSIHTPTYCQCDAYDFVYCWAHPSSIQTQRTAQYYRFWIIIRLRWHRWQWLSSISSRRVVFFNENLTKWEDRHNVDRGGTMKSSRAVWFWIESSHAVDMLTMARHATIWWIIQYRRRNCDSGNLMWIGQVGIP